MFVRNLSPLLFLLAAYVLSGCAQTAQVTEDANAVQRMGVRSSPVDYYDSVQLASTTDSLVQLRYDQANQKEKLVFRKLNSGEEQVLNLGDPTKSKSNFAVLNTDGNSVYAAWRPKLFEDESGVGGAGDKFVYFKASHDGGLTFEPAKRLSSEGGAFIPVMASADGKYVYVTWVDERNGAQFDLYVNASQDGGATWATSETRLDQGDHRIATIDPKIVAEGSKAWITWVEGETPIAVYSRATTDGGVSWGKAVLVTNTMQAPLRPTLIRTKGKLFTYWYSSQGVGGAWSSDDGASWRAIPLIPDTDGALDLAVTTDRNGYIHMAVGRKPTASSLENMFYLRAEDGIQFSQPIRVSGGVPFDATATLPEISVDSNGAVLVVWQDQRYFRASINANISKDNGRTWPKEDFSVNDKAGVVFALYPRVASLGSSFSIGWTEFDTTLFNTGRTVNRLVGASLKLPGAGAIAPNEERLKQRFTAYWNSRIQADLSKTYTFMDPMFRDRNKKEAYIANQATFTYFSANPESFVVTGNRGKVALSYEFELPEVMLGGKMIKVPRTTEKTVQDWIWIDGDWYLVYKNIMGKDLLVY